MLQMINVKKDELSGKTINLIKKSIFYSTKVSYSNHNILKKIKIKPSKDR